MSKSMSSDLTSSGSQRDDRAGAGWRSLPGLSLLLSMIGLGVASYLTYVHYQEEALVCTTGGCETVQQSQYSTIGPIPIAILGVAFFAIMVVLASSRVLNVHWISEDQATLGAWGLALTASLYYAYLVYLELFVLDAICQWCMLTTIATVFILVTESILVWRWYTDEAAPGVE